MVNFSFSDCLRQPHHRLARPLAALGLLLATAGAARAQTLTIQGMGSASAPGSDVTAFVDKVEIVRVPDGVVMTGALANAGFETPGLGAGNFAYRPTGATWTFTGNAGISNSGGGFSPPAIPEGSQTALIQTSPSAVAQPLTLAAGTYQVRFLATQRTNCCGAPYDQRLTVSVGGTQVGTTTPPASGFTSFTSNAFSVNGSGAVTTNNALAFDGANDVVLVPHNAAYNIATAITLEAWVRTSVTGERYITTKENDSWYLAMSGGGGPAGAASFYLNGPSGGSGGWLYGTSNLADGKWHHVAGTYDGATLRLYVDGVQENSRAVSSSIQTGGSNPVSIGARSGGNFWNGSLDEFRLYNTALTQAQIQADMYSTTAAVPGSLKAYYNFDHGVAGGNNTGITSLPDFSSTNNAGTLNNFALTGTSSNWVRSFPTITGISPSSGPAGTSVTVTGTNLTDATGFAFNGTATTGFATPTDDLTATVTVPSGATTGPVSVRSATLAGYNGPVFTVPVTATTWTGAVSSDWFTNGNWSAGVPTASLDATIAAGTPNAPSIGTGAATVRNLTLNSGATLTMTNGTLTLAANLTNNGTFQPTGGTVSLGATAQSSVLGSGSTRFWNLTVGTNGAQQSTSASTSVQQLLTLNGNFATNGNPFTLVSNAAGTALVVNNGSSVVNGNVTVQRYIDPSLNPNRGYRHVSTAVSGQTVNSLTTGSYSPVVNPAYNTSPTPLLTTPFPTVYGYDQSRLTTASNNLNAFDKGWFSPGATTDALNVGQGYTVLIGGGQTWNFTGPLTNGDQTVAVANSGPAATTNGYNLIGNPYPAPLDWSQVVPADRPNVGGAMYVYRSNDPSNPYTGVYGVYNNGVGISPVVAQGQGFFVQVPAGQTTGAVTFRNSQRVTTYTSPTYQRTTETRPLVELNLQSAGSSLSDAAFVYFEQGATTGFDAQFDAEKLPNPSGLNLSTSLNATQGLAIDGRAPLGTLPVTVPLVVGVPAAGSYTLRAEQLLNIGATPVYLRDRQSGALVDLRAQPGYAFTVSNASTLITGRFELVFSPQGVLATAPAALAAQVGLYPNPATAVAAIELPAALGRADVPAALVDALGRMVRVQSLPAQGAAAHRLSLAGLAAGVYTLRLQTTAGVITKKLVVE